MCFTCWRIVDEDIWLITRHFLNDMQIIKFFMTASRAANNARRVMFFQYVTQPFLVGRHFQRMLIGKVRGCSKENKHSLRSLVPHTLLQKSVSG